MDISPASEASDMSTGHALPTSNALSWLDASQPAAYTGSARQEPSAVTHADEDDTEQILAMLLR